LPPKGNGTFAASSASSKPPQIVLRGLSIRPEHAVIVVDDDDDGRLGPSTVRIRPLDADAELLVNGARVEPDGGPGTVLAHNDRYIKYIT